MNKYPFDAERVIDLNSKPAWADLNITPDAQGLVPAIVQDSRTKTVLMLGYISEASWAETIQSGKVCFFSRSRQELWTKGATSGNYLHLEHAALDCDRDALLLLVRPDGPVCHTGTESCWGETNTHPSFLFDLEQQIWHRKANPSEESYTTALFQKGTHKIAQKVGEEAVETVIEALLKDNDRLKSEVSDLLYHLLVLLADRSVTLSEIEEILISRNKK